jgi:hypothetical protein
MSKEITHPPSAPRDAVPRRHGIDPIRARKLAQRIRWSIKGDPEPSECQWRAIGESLTRGDPPMDRVVDWMVAEGLGQTKQLFDLALERGIGEVPDAPRALRDLFAIIDVRPRWVDPDRLREGARVSGIAGLTGMDVLRDFALVAGYQASAVNRTLILTKALEKGQQRRIAETSKWWVDVTRPGGMERFADGFKSTLQVRLIHALVRRHLRSHPEWDADMYGLPINQGDMQATNLGFSVVYLLAQRALGVIITRAEGRDVMHLWRYIGWLIGVDEAWLCDTERQGRIALYQNALSQAPADESSRLLGAALVDEPLMHFYPNLRWLRGHWHRAKHLSIARAYLGADAMKSLGMPHRTLPWYPVLTVGPRLLWHALHRVVPGGRERLIARGLAEQQSTIRTLFGAHDPRIAAAHVLQAHAARPKSPPTQMQQVQGAQRVV